MDNVMGVLQGGIENMDPMAEACQELGGTLAQGMRIPAILTVHKGPWSSLCGICSSEALWKAPAGSQGAGRQLQTLAPSACPLEA